MRFCSRLCDVRAFHERVSRQYNSDYGLYWKLASIGDNNIADPVRITCRINQSAFQLQYFGLAT